MSCLVRLIFVADLMAWIYLWLAKISQQPISHTTWLKFTLLMRLSSHPGLDAPVNN
jgi:hypothetical protein